jgi:16S rRNA (guanine527-N7)-methyltransferase
MNGASRKGTGSRRERTTGTPRRERTAGTPRRERASRGKRLRGNTNGQGGGPRARSTGAAATKPPRRRAQSPRITVTPKAAPIRRGPLRAGPALVESAPDLAQRWPDVTALLKRQPWDTLIPHLLKIGADPDPSIVRLRRFSEMLVQWNRKVSNLVSKNDEGRIVTRHILESLEPGHWLRDCGAKRWLDFGSGGGLPAIPLAIGGIGTEWTLVESRRTKTLFMRRALEDLGIRNISVVNARLEDLLGASEHAGAYGGFTSRATQTLAPTLAIAAAFVQPGGTAFLWKGSRREEEMAADKAWREAWDFDGLLGIGDGTTTVARFKRK